MATQNQIKLREVILEEAKLEEDKRHHLAEEQINAQHYGNQDIASLMQAQASKTQADVATSRLSIDWYDAATKRAQQVEQSRHNIETEILESQRLEEIERHNRVGEQQEWSALDISQQRADIADYESKTGRRQYELNKDYYTMEKWRLGKDFVNTGVSLKQNQEKLDQGNRALDLKEKELGLKYRDTPATNRNNVRSSGNGGRISDSNGIFGEVGDRVDSIIRAITGQD